LGDTSVPEEASSVLAAPDEESISIGEGGFDNWLLAT
jgi:hypothetical protein